MDKTDTVLTEREIDVHGERFKLNHGISLQSQKNSYVTVRNCFAVTVSNWNVNSNCFQMKFQVTALTILHELKFNCWTVPPKRKASFNKLFGEFSKLTAAENIRGRKHTQTISVWFRRCVSCEHFIRVWRPGRKTRFKIIIFWFDVNKQTDFYP